MNLLRVTLFLLLLSPGYWAQKSAPPKSSGETRNQERKYSMAMRQNPAIRAYFRERYSSLPVQDVNLVANPARDDFLEKAVDNMIDMNTDKVWKLADELHAERDLLWSAMTPEMLETLRNYDRAGADSRPGPLSTSRILELRGALKKAERAAGELDSHLAFIRFTMDVSMAFRLGKAEGEQEGKIHRDIEDIARAVGSLEDSLYELYFPVKGAVSLDALTRESIPYTLEKIRKLAERAYAALGGR